MSFLVLYVWIEANLLGYTRWLVQGIRYFHSMLDPLQLVDFAGHVSEGRYGRMTLTVGSEGYSSLIPTLLLAGIQSQCWE